jgi:alkanesulfonate monooxygenase SsuD/methylene tetrahydromethanopterin reductase-like flavin-dependent oxidoreductase (luciferase family)
MRLATGIVNPFTRGPAVLAQTAAALQEASEGRFVLGLGSSSDVVVERFNDGTFAKPLSKVREAVQRLRPVLAAPPEKGFGGLRLERPVTDTVPIVLAALRARMLGLAGELADGVFTNFLPVSGTELVLAAYRDGAVAAGRDPGEFVCRFLVLPGDEGLELARMMFVNYGSVPVYTEFFRWLGWGERLDPMVEAYRAGDRKRALELAPDELISEIYVTGSIAQIRERLAEFVAGGITTVVLAPLCAPEQLPELLEALAPR